MGRGSRLVRFPQSDIVDEVRMNPLGRERQKEGECAVDGVISNERRGFCR
jgi:hypothetical protein